MSKPLFDAAARKRTVSLTLNSDLYARAKAEGINASQVAEAALAEALAAQLALTARMDRARSPRLRRLCREARLADGNVERPSRR